MGLDLTDQSTLTFGDVNAPHEVTVVENLACPFCRRWMENNIAKVEAGVKSGRLLAHFKFLDKDKADLQNGNLAHQYIDYANPAAAIEFVKQAYAKQPEWRELDRHQAADYFTQQLGVRPVNDADFLAGVKANIEAEGFPSVPTIVYDGDAVSDSSFALPE